VPKFDSWISTRKSIRTHEGKKGNGKKRTINLGIKVLLCRVARWFVFKPKIPIWVNFFGGPYIGNY
jgi:hypothetical protein